MLHSIRFFLLIFSFSFLYPKNDFLASENLWHQIVPLVGNIDITQAQTTEEALKACTAQALLQDGKAFNKLDSEIFQTLESLHLFSHVLPKINKTHLRLGCFYFAKNMCQVTDDASILQNRMARTKYLQQNPMIIDEINNALCSLKETEKDFLINFYIKSPNKNDTETNFILKGVKFCEKINNTIYGNRYIGEFITRSTQLAYLALIYGSINTIFGWSKQKQVSIEKVNIQNSMIPALKDLGVQNINDNFTNGTLTARFEKEETETTLNIKGVYNTTVNNTASYYKPFFNLFTDEKTAQKTAYDIASFPTMSLPSTALSILTTIFLSASTAVSLKREFDASYNKNKSLILIKDLIKASKNIADTVKNHPELEQFIDNYSIIKAFADYKKSSGILSDKMIHLIGLLDYYPFNSEPNYFISWQGKIHETFLLYEEISKEFMPLWEAFAELDAQVCVQKLLEDDQGFCIPQWINQPTPALDIQGYWHPVISKEKAVKNNISLGIRNNAPNCIITGANAGGKTTAMTAMMLCVILGQSIGIVPAQSYLATPFARMHTYLDITTNLVNNESLFMAQANRAKHLFDSIKSCDSNQKTFTILDEIFTGTRADFAEKASCQFAQALASMKHSMAIIATHFPKLTDLEATKLFVNYQAAAARINDDGSLTYPYLIIPGISTQNIAEHILKNKGIL